MSCFSNFSPCSGNASRRPSTSMQTGYPMTGYPTPYTGMMPSTGMPSSIPLPPAPTGGPTGPVYSPPVPFAPPATTVMEPDVVMPQTVLNIQYTQGYLKTQIGRKVKIEFLIGTNMLVDREGTLMEVGTSYLIIRETETDDLLLCDMYSIKFVKFYY